MLGESMMMDASRSSEASMKMQQEMNINFTFPYDLNKLCVLSFDVLKDSIEFLARQQAEMNHRLGKLESQGNVYAPITIIDKGKTDG